MTPAQLIYKEIRELRGRASELNEQIRHDQVMQFKAYRAALKRGEDPELELPLLERYEEYETTAGYRQHEGDAMPATLFDAEKVTHEQMRDYCEKMISRDDRIRERLIPAAIELARIVEAHPELVKAGEEEVVLGIKTAAEAYAPVMEQLLLAHERLRQVLGLAPSAAELDKTNSKSMSR